MAAMGAEVSGSWFLSPGLIGFFVLLILLSILLTALCSDCNRHSFELQHSETEKHPTALIRVVKLEEVKENPMIGEIQKDEKDPSPSEGTPVHVTPRRSHLVAPESRDLSQSKPPAAGEGRSQSGQKLAPPTNYKSTQLQYLARSDDKHSVHARVSKKLRLTDSPGPTPEGVEPKQEEEESPPPLPDRRTWTKNEGGSRFTSQ